MHACMYVGNRAAHSMMRSALPRCAARVYVRMEYTYNIRCICM